MTINVLYNRVYSGDTVKIECDKSTYETVRTGLLRKYKTTTELMSEIGDDSLTASYIRTSFDAVGNVATFSLQPVAAKKRSLLSYKLL